jgi:hypothetical protein
LMMRQRPEDRPQTIGDLKRQLVVRASQYIEFQKLNALKNAVVATTSADVPFSVRVMSVDYQNNELIFALEPRPTPEWVDVFRNLARYKGSVTSLMGRGTETVRFMNSEGIIRVSPHEVQPAVEYFKQWVTDTNGVLPTVRERQARARDTEERERIRKAAEAEEARQKVLAAARQALG